MKSIIVLVLLGSTAAAEPYYPYAASPGPAPEPKPFVDSGYVGGGVGLTHDHFFNTYVDLELGYRLGDLPLWLHGQGAIGNSIDVEGGGRYKMLRGGLETRTCSRSGACLFLGLDFGHQSQVWESQDEMTEHHDGSIYVTRAGIDVGGDHTRFRLAAEAYRYARSSDVDGLPDRAIRGGGLSLAVVHRM